uniref:Uncharacterized protein n=1 Tax=Hordeum vulgare subsp. vulgare TaxID=112509 RepID=A0A8I6WY94_HORVV
MVLRRKNGLLIFAAYRYIFNCNDAFEAEIHTLMQGMHWFCSIRICPLLSSQILQMLWPPLRTMLGLAVPMLVLQYTAVWLNSSPTFCEDLLSRDCNPSCLE